MVPPALDGPSTSPSTTWSVAPQSVGLLNHTAVEMHFNASGTAFDLAPNAAKTIDLPAGMRSLTLTYSMKGQQKQITLTPGRSYVLDIDVAKVEIVSH